MKELTPTQAAYTRVIVECWEERVPCTFRNLCEAFTVNSTNTAIGIVRALEKKGYVIPGTPSKTGIFPTDLAIDEFGSMWVPWRRVARDLAVKQLVEKWEGYRKNGRFTLPIVEVVKELDEVIGGGYEQRG